ncbi:MAG TPA: GFA family protein [Stellaceae bacterium]|jgi:hypothetical protein
MDEVSHSGGCLCGAVRYRAAGAPTGTSICHCTQCRRQTGAPFAAFASFPAERVALLAGQPAVYRATPGVVREFCPACGSTLFWRRDGDGKIDVFLGSLDDPAAMPPPAAQLWIAHRLPWLPSLPGAVKPPAPEG